MKTKRIEGFDLLRGLCAIAVACYHILSWLGAAHLDSWGRYGVYIFFVLSGASMYVAYNRKFAQGYDAAKFVVFRFIRLAPLFAVVLAVNITYLVLKGQSLLDVLSLALLNISFAFGFGNPGGTSLVTGGWSLGIEFLFYLTFPLLVAVIRGRYWLTIVAAAFVAQHLFITQVLAGTTLAAAGVSYTQMLSFIFYFVAGCCIGRLIENRVIHPSPIWVAGFVALSMPLAVIHGENNLLGLTGVTLSLCSAAIVLASAGLPLSGATSWVADCLGKMSYGVYLIHPLVYAAGKNLLADQSPILVAIVVITISALAALVSEKYFEAPVRRKLQKVIDR